VKRRTIKSIKKDIKLILEDDTSRDDIKSIVEKLILNGKVITKGKKYTFVDKNECGAESTVALESHSDDKVQFDEEAVKDHAANIASNREYVIDPTLESGNVTILLFYAYCTPVMTRAEQDSAIAFCYSTLSSRNVTGRLRVGREVRII
jgi:hypothetical protein